MNICLIGNSHASGAYALLRDGKTPYDVDYFIERSAGTSCLKIKESLESDVVDVKNVMLTHSKPVNASRYGAFAIFSMGFSFGRCVELYRDYAPDSQPNEKAKFVVSDSFFDAAIKSVLFESKAVRIMRILRDFSDRPIILVPQPLPLEWAATRILRRTQVFADALRNNFIEHIYCSYMSVIKELRDEGFIILDQPDESLASKYFTRSKFGLADPADERPDSLYSRGDFFHANKSYAQIVLKDIGIALQG